jgi:hypothetical protein
MQDSKTQTRCAVSLIFHLVPFLTCVNNVFVGSFIYWTCVSVKTVLIILLRIVFVLYIPL